MCMYKEIYIKKKTIDGQIVRWVDEKDMEWVGPPPRRYYGGRGAQPRATPASSPPPAPHSTGELVKC